MARSFASASGQYLYQTSPVTAVPFTISYWVYTVSSGTKQNPLCIVGTDWDGFYTELQSDGYVHVNAYAGGDAIARTTTTYTANTWHHVFFVLESATARSAMLNGAGRGTNSTSSTPGVGGSPSLAIASMRGPDTSSYDYLNGRMAEVTLWNAALTEAEGIALARGASALTIRPESLVRYWPFVRTDQDLVGGSSLTAVNTPTWADHAPRGHYRAFALGMFHAPAAGGTDDCTAQDIASGVPVVEESTIGQAHALTAQDIASGVPTVEKSTADESVHALTAQDIASGVPTVEKPTIGQAHALTAQDVTSGVPTVEKAALKPLVVRVYSDAATNWDYGSSYYGSYVDQDVVNAMVDAGVMALTNTASVAAAWQALIPGYSVGKGIAIKASFNNTWVCSPTHLNIDALIQPVNAIIRGLYLAYPGLDEEDIWVYEGAQVPEEEWGARQIAGRFISGCLYEDVQFFDYSCNGGATYLNTDADALITWNEPAGTDEPPTTRLCDVLVDADYVINMPILKRHWAAGISGALKNHFGSIADPQSLHDWMYPSGDNYDGTDYNVIVDLNLNTHIRDKTVLILMDGLFGQWENNNEKPKAWTTFGNGAPNSLLFALDPVAVDSVMADICDDEYALDATARDVLVYAATAGLGVHDDAPYSDLAYLEIAAAITEDIASGVPTVEKPTMGQTHALTAQDVASGVPVVEQATVGQTHALTAQDVASGVPVVEEATAGQAHALTAQDVASGVPVVEQATLGQTHALTAQDVASGVPVVEQANIGQTHALTAQDVTSGVPVVEQATLSEGNHNLTALDVTSGIPVVDQATLGQTHALTAQDVTSGVPVVEQATLSEGNHNLTALDVTSGIPVVDQATLGQTHALTTQDVTSGVPVVEQATLFEGNHALTAQDVASGVPVVEQTTIGQAHALNAQDIASDVPVVEQATAGIEGALVALDVTFAVPVVEQTTIGQAHALNAQDIASDVPVVEQATLAESDHNLTAQDIAVGVPTVEQASIGQGHALTAQNVTFGVPVAEQTIIGQIHTLTATDVASEAPVVEQATPGIWNVLVALDVTFGVPVVEQATIGQTHALTAQDVASGVPTVEESTLTMLGVRIVLLTFALSKRSVTISMQ